MSTSESARERPSPPGDGTERDRAAESLLTPGGKVDPDALRRVSAEADSADEDDPGLRRIVLTIQRSLKTRLDKYLTSRVTFMSRNQLQRLIEGGGVTVNGGPAKPSTKISRGDVIELVVPPPPSGDVVPEDIPIDVLYEDEHMIVLNKRPDIIVHPARAELSGTLINALAHHLRFRSGGDLSSVGGEFGRPGVVHRLDRHTSGCIVFAKDDEAHWKLGRQFEKRTVDKRYLALVEGILEPEADVIEAPIGPHPSREKGYREKYVVRHDDLGKPSVTIYRVRERYRGGVAGRLDGFTLVELELKTGRTHQIRVHLSHRGFPIVGDDMYGGRPLADESGHVLLDKQALHAAVLGVQHPIDGRPMVFTAPLRGNIAEAVRYLRTVSRVERPEVAGTTVDLDWACPPAEA